MYKVYITLRIFKNATIVFNIPTIETRFNFRCLQSLQMSSTF